MKAELKALGVCLWRMLVEFVTSKKVLTAVLTSVAGLVIKDPATRDHVLAVGVTLIGGIAIADAGKVAAAKKADAASAVAPKP